MQAIAQVARGQILSVFAGKRPAVYGKDHRQRWLVNQQRLKRRRRLQIRDALADLNVFDASDRDDITCGNRFGFVAFQSAKGKKLGDLRRLDFAVQLADAYFLAALQSSIEHARDGDAPQKLAVIQVHHLNLQYARGIARRRGNMLHDGFKQGQQIFRIVTEFVVGHAAARIGVNDWKIELVFGSVQVDEQVVDFVEHFFRTRVGTVNFVQYDHRRQLRRKSFLQDVARLRQGPFARVDQHHHAVDQPKRALDFPAEIAVARRVHNVDFRPAKKQRRIFRQNGNTALAFQFV